MVQWCSDGAVMVRWYYLTTRHSLRWASPPPRSPVAAQGELLDIVLLPYGATDLRVAELPTTAK